MDKKTGKQKIDRAGNLIWLLTVSAGFKANGDRKRVRRDFHGSKPKATVAHARLVVEVNNGRHVESSEMLLQDWAEIWDKEHVSCKLSAKTAATYRMMLKNRIVPALGKIRLDRLTPTHIQRFYAQLNSADGIRLDKKGGKPRPGPLKDATKAKIHRILSAMLQEAVYRQLIQHNPARDTRAPQEKCPEIKYFEESNIRRLLEVLPKESLRFRALVMLALSTGMRRGEIIGLTWDQVNWDDSIITVRQAASFVAGIGQQLKAPKTRQSVRHVGIPEPAEQALRAWQRQQESERETAGSLWKNEGNYVFTTHLGAWCYIDAVGKEWSKFIDRINAQAEAKEPKEEKLPRLTFHGLRHTAASILIAGGVDIRSVSGVLGHAQAATTLNRYSHMLELGAQKAAAAMQGMLERNAG